MKTKVRNTWLENLPPGKYTLEDLTQISGKSKNAICQLFRTKRVKEYGVFKKEYRAIEGHPVQIAVYDWGGFLDVS